MKYSREVLQEYCKEGRSIELLFFWGHTPPYDGSIDKACLSQWWKSKFEIEDEKFCCMEQYMMAEKALLFDDRKILHEIMSCDNPKTIKAQGREVSNFNSGVWEQKRSDIVIKGNLAKFFQNEELKKYLLGTNSKVLVEASPYDRIWGIGLSADDEKSKNPLLWRGSNLLGFALMEVRDELMGRK